jgi:hypothetical protein
MSLVAALPAAIAPAGSGAAPRDVAVATPDALRRAVAEARPGTRILLAPGDYGGGFFFSEVKGAPGQPIVLAAADPARPPIFGRAGLGMHLADPAHVELNGLVFAGVTGNGLNIDDAGTAETPAHHVVLRNLVVRDVGPHGNRDGIKLSGLDDFQILGCTLQRWGDGGSGVDMVGCHRGRIEGCTFREGGSEAVQAKGGSSEIVIRRNRFLEYGGRGVNIGGSTGRPYFRPRVQGYEARDIRVEENLFVGGIAPVAFVGADGAVVRSNTIYRPGRWALRILQETVAPDFVPCRNGVFEENVVVFRSDQWVEGGVNVGPSTAPQTFRFARNLWFCEDRPDRSAPRLPVSEAGAVVGRDPLFQDAARGDFRLRAGSPAAGRGYQEPERR